MSDGTVKEYQYELDKDAFNAYMREYQINAGLTELVVCDKCGRNVQKRNLKNHQLKNICKTKEDKPITTSIRMPTGFRKVKQ